MILSSPVLRSFQQGIINVKEDYMNTKVIEKIMNCLLSVLMATFFIVLAPLWTIFYGSLLLKDYMAAIKA